MEWNGMQYAGHMRKICLQCVQNFNYECRKMINSRTLRKDDYPSFCQTHFVFVLKACARFVRRLQFDLVPFTIARSRILEWNWNVLPDSNDLPKRYAQMKEKIKIIFFEFHTKKNKKKEINEMRKIDGAFVAFVLKLFIVFFSAFCITK